FVPLARKEILDADAGERGAPGVRAVEGGVDHVDGVAYAGEPRVLAAAGFEVRARSIDRVLQALRYLCAALRYSEPQARDAVLALRAIEQIRGVVDVDGAGVEHLLA